MRQIRANIERVWRWIESIHTVVWIAPGVLALGATVLGITGGVEWFWILTLVPIATLSLLLLARELYWQVGFVSLDRASTVAFNRLVGTRYHQYACDTWPHPDRRQEYVATGIATYAPLYGVRPPGEKLEKLPKNELARGGIRNMGCELWYHGAAQPTYVNLSIERRHLQRAVRALRKGGDEYLAPPTK